MTYRGGSRPRQLRPWPKAPIKIKIKKQKKTPQLKKKAPNKNMNE
jgi:hypothetical protein